MAAIFFISAFYHIGGICTVCGGRQFQFETIDDFKIALWRAHVDPARHWSSLQELSQGGGIRISITEAQKNRFCNAFCNECPKLVKLN